MKREITVWLPGETIVPFDEECSETNSEALEQIFAWFNAGSGNEHRLFKAMRSLSVGDFVGIDRQWFQCLSIGWRNVSFDFVRKIEDAVQHRMNVAVANNKQESPWFILNSMKHEQNWPLV